LAPLVEPLLLPLPLQPRVLLQVIAETNPHHFINTKLFTFFPPTAERAARAAAGVVAGSTSSDAVGGKRLRVQDAEIDLFMKDIDSIFGGT
jgi:hypothetical protein